MKGRAGSYRSWLQQQPEIECVPKPVDRIVNENKVRYPRRKLRPPLHLAGSSRYTTTIRKHGNACCDSPHSSPHTLFCFPSAAHAYLSDISSYVKPKPRKP